jgi:simple sugar transport system permease protein
MSASVEGTWSRVTRVDTPRRAAAVSTVTGLGAAWLVFALLVWAYGEAPREIAVELARGTWGTAYGAGQVLFKATPLLITGVAVDVALRAGLFNIGGEGQAAIASLAVATVGAHLSVIPGWIGVPFLIVVGLVAGAAWALPAAVLRARFGAHEVISTIMLNKIADAVVGLALASGLALAGTVRTPDIAPNVRLPKLEVISRALHGSAASFALVVAIAAVVVMALWRRTTRLGRETTLVGLSTTACAAERIPVARRLGWALVLSGAVAGLVSVPTVLGYKGYFEEGLGAGAGFGGIAVALLGRGHPVGMVLAALLFGTLQQGGLAINGHVPMELMDILQGVVIVAVGLSDARIRAALSRGGA